MSNFTYIDIPSPLDQFEVRDLLSLDLGIFGNYHFALTNIGLYLTIGLLFIITMNIASTNYNKLVSNN